MNNWYLGVEGVNLGNFVYDTENLSTIRGGGLLLLHAINSLSKQFESQLQPVTTGASSGLFQILPNDSPKAVQHKVIKYLHSHPSYKHATFVVNLHHAEQDYPLLREAILAKNRWQQMQSPSLAIPTPFSGNLPCHFDKIRPATNRKGPMDESVCESVYQRWSYGKKQKQKFYETETGIECLPEFVTDLDSLTTGPRATDNLNHKMAVIYIDGNDFGKIQREYCRSKSLYNGIKKQRQFDKDIKLLRRNLLKELLKDMTASHTTAAWYNSGKIRFETLLWGGDEIIWVVPAWCGWWTLGRFFQLANDWKLDYGTILTHAAGIVFCHYKAPIHRMTELAKSLAELAKKIDRTRNLAAYEVLESFDNAGNDLETFRTAMRPLIVQADQMMLSGEHLLSVLQHQPELRETLSRRRLFNLVRYLYQTNDPADVEISKLADAMANDAGSKAQAAIQNMRPCFGTLPAFWIHLITLWDYLVDPKEVHT